MRIFCLYSRKSKFECADSRITGANRPDQAAGLASLHVRSPRKDSGGSPLKAPQPQFSKTWLCLLLGIPFGPAAQAIVAACAISTLLIRRFISVTGARRTPARIESATMFLFLWLLWNLANSLFQEVMNGLQATTLLFDYLPLLIIPYLGSSSRPLFWTKSTERAVVVMMSLWALVAFSQSISGWSLNSFPWGPYVRSQGFYSHPLTLAYVILLFWPLSQHYFAIQWQTLGRVSAATMLAASSVLAILYLSGSRTCQAVAFLAAILGAVIYLPKRTMIPALAGMVIVVTLIVGTPNRLGSKFQSTFSSEGVDRYSSYPDDRLAFWHAHWLMFLDKPFTGHGRKISREIRQHYYTRLGLKNFEKPYTAHNMYLQTLAEGGVVSLLLFFGWGTCLMSYASRNFRDKPYLWLMLFVFFLAGTTQNAVQDSEVRYALAVLLGLLLAGGCRVESAPQSIRAKRS